MMLVINQYWSRDRLFSEILNELAPLKDRTTKEDHMPYMNSDLRKKMYKCNMLKNRHLKDRSNPIKWLLYRQQQNNVTDMRRKAMREFFYVQM